MQSAVVRLEVTLLAHFALLRPPEASQDKPLFSSRKKILGEQDPKATLRTRSMKITRRGMLAGSEEEA